MIGIQRNKYRMHLHPLTNQVHLMRYAGFSWIAVYGVRH